MQVNWPTVEALVWFYSGAAEADAGARSVQGGFEATMLRLALCGRARPGHASSNGQHWIDGDIPAHESRATASRFDLPLGDEVTTAGLLVAQVEQHIGRRTTETRSSILARLRGLDSRLRATLELQFADERWLCGDGRIYLAQRAVLDRRWGVSLALLCNTSRIATLTERTNVRRDKRGSDRVDARDALLLLLTKTSSDPKSTAIVVEMVEEASDVVGVALEAFGAGGA